MALPNITFQKGSGGLGRPLAGQDFISGLIFYASTLPSGFTTSNNILKFLSINDAIAAGINQNYTDETPATGTYLITASGNNGDVVTLTSLEPNGVVVTLGSYTKVTGDSTPTLVATAIKNAINALTVNTGYSATSSTATVTITARKRLGIFPNSGTPLVATLSAGATLAGTLTQYSGGVASRNAVYYYHISRFFKLQPKGILYTGIFPIPGSYTFTEVNTLQNFTGGILRQVGVYKDGTAFSTADLTALSAACVTSDTAKKNLSALLGADISATSDISTLTDLSVLTANKASAIISQDGANQGSYLFQTFGKSITDLGAALGAVALAAANQSIGWVQKFNIADPSTGEDGVLAFANGKLFSDASVTDNLLNTLDAYRYIFLRSFPGVTGSYFNAGHTAITVSSDYAYIEDNRTIDKAIRGVYTSLIQQLNGPLLLNSDGTLSNTTVAYLITEADTNLLQMVRANEISDFAVTIDPTQNVLSTGIINVAVRLIQNGVSRNINVPIQYVQSLS